MYNSVSVVQVSFKLVGTNVTTQVRYTRPFLPHGTFRRLSTVPCNGIRIEGKLEKKLVPYGTDGRLLRMPPPQNTAATWRMVL